MAEPSFAASRTLLPALPLRQPRTRGGLPPFGGHLSSRRRRRRRRHLIGISYVPAVSMECTTHYDNGGFSSGFFGILKTTTTNAKKAFLMFCKWLELDESVFAELISRQNHFSVLAGSLCWSSVCASAQTRQGGLVEGHTQLCCLNTKLLNKTLEESTANV